MTGMAHTVLLPAGRLWQYFCQSFGILAIVPNCENSNLSWSLFVENEIVSYDFDSRAWIVSLFSDVGKFFNELNSLFD